MPAGIICKCNMLKCPHLFFRNEKGIAIKVVGHTSHVVHTTDGDIMFVIFGHSPIYGYMNTVQKYNISEYVWDL